MATMTQRSSHDSLLSSADTVLQGARVDEGTANNFFVVCHTFEEGTEETWWAAGSAEVHVGFEATTRTAYTFVVCSLSVRTRPRQADTESIVKTGHDTGVFAHAFMPSDVSGPVPGPILGLWECRDHAMGAAQFQTFIDGPTSPTAGLTTKVFPIQPAGVLPASAWPMMPSAPAASTGSFFWVKHAFVSEAKAAEFWAAMPGLDMEAVAAANKAKGFHNHFFMPTSDPVSIFCVWESEAPTSVADFQTFIDGEVFSSTFINKVYPVMEGGNVPSAAFPQTTES
jgi:hypothetical protein